MPEPYPRYLGKFLNQLPTFRRDYSSLPGIYKRIASRNAQSFYLRRFVFLYGAVSSSSPPRTHDVRVVDTSLIFSVIALTFSQPFMEVELFFRFRILSEICTARDYIRRVVH